MAPELDVRRINAPAGNVRAVRLGPTPDGRRAAGDYQAERSRQQRQPPAQ
jgi:hypothetical protein